MSGALLAPAALALGVLLVGPVLAHMARQQPVRRVPFGAMMLLRRLVRRLERRRRIRDLLLLLLRLLAVLLVVLAVTRPELRWPGGAPELGGTGAVVVVLDNSLSMDLREAGQSAEETALSRARTEAVDLVRGLPPGTQVGAVTIAGAAERLTPTLSSDPDAVAASLARVQQSQAGTDLRGGIREARRLLAGQGGEVVVFTDEAGPVAVPAATDELSLLTEQGGALVPRSQRTEDAANVAVVDARYGSGPEGGSVRVRVANYGPAEVEVPVTVELPDGTEITAFVVIAPGETAEEAVTVPRVSDGGVGLARVQDGRLAADDAFAFHLPRVGASRVLVVDGDPGPTPTASEVYFLERALAPWGASAAMQGGVLPELTSPSGISALDPEEHRVVFLANVSEPAPLAARLIDFVRSGGGLVIGLGDNVTAERYNGALALLLPAPLRRVRSLANPGEEGVGTELPDVGLELFRPFARGGRTAFGKVRWRRLHTLEPYDESDQVRTLLRTRTGIPLLVERRLGQGRVLWLTGTFDRDWGDFPLQAAFMPWVQQVVRYLGADTGGGGLRETGRVGETQTVTLPEGVLDVSVTGPGGAVPAQVRGSTVSFEPIKAGAYLVETPGAPPLAWVAVNVDPQESDVRPGPSLIETAAEIDPERFLVRLDLGEGLLGGALLLALLQALVASRRREDPTLEGDMDEEDRLAS